MPHFPPPQIPKPVARFQRVPPAIFPPVLGLLGLVSAWGQAVRLFHLNPGAVQMATGMVTLLFLFCTGCYLVKVTRRPGVIREDLGILPGRTGLAAWCISMIVQAGLLAPFAGSVAKLFLAIGGVCLLAIALFVLTLRLQRRDTTGPATPAMHLVFVGFILIPGAATAMAMTGPLLTGLIWYGFAAGLFLTILTIRPLLLAEGAPPLRPLQAIQLAPASFCAVGGIQTGQNGLAAVALIWAAVITVLLLVRIRWLTKGPFSGFWSAFTFPVTALVSAGLLGSEVFGLPLLRAISGLILVAATLYIPVIAWRILKLWSTGVLAAKTNAAIA